MKKFFSKNSVKILFLFLIFSFTFALSGRAQTTPLQSSGIFSKNLTLGNDNADVVALKQVLNSNPLTKIEKSGLIEEKTTFFGPDTRRAVIKFQELYRESILFPNGLTKGTGFVGPSTRVKLNEVAKSLNLQGNSSVVGETDSLIARLKALLGGRSGVSVKMAQKYQISPLGTVVLDGSGFTPQQNTVHIDGVYQITNVTSSNGTSLRFTLPKELPKGKHAVWVTNANGSSRNPIAEVFFVVTDNPVPNPEITAVFPAFATIEDEITIQGKGFTATGNNLYTGLGHLSNLSSSDGVTLKVKLKDFPSMVALANTLELKNTNHSLAMYVQNENGSSLSPYIFTISIK